MTQYRYNLHRYSKIKKTDIITPAKSTEVILINEKYDFPLFSIVFCMNVTAIDAEEKFPIGKTWKK